MSLDIATCRRLLNDHHSTDEEIAAIRDALDPFARFAVASFIKQHVLKKQTSPSANANAR